MTPYICVRSRGLTWLLSVGLVLATLLPVHPLAAQTSVPKTSRALANSGSKYRSDRLLVRFRPNVPPSTIQALHLRLGSNVIREVRAVDRLQVVRPRAGSSIEDTVRRYRADPAVLYAEPDYLIETFDVLPNDPQFTGQWNLHNTGQGGGTPGADIHAPQAWALSTGSSNVVVAVIDTGVDYTHPDLASQVWTANAPFSATGYDGAQVDCPVGSRGLDSFDDDCDPMDDSGHGSHIAGIIGAAGNNGVGVAGVNWNVKILPCKALNVLGQGDVSSTIGCLDWIKSLKDSGLNIVATNNSYGGFNYSQALQDAIAAQMTDGILFVAAAGNSYSDNDLNPVYPANISLPNVISVAATDRNDRIYEYSDFGRHTVHIGAPGVSILSTTPFGTYSTLTGTSLAAAHVAGVAALLAAQDPTRDWRSIKNLILSGGDPDSSLSETISKKRLDAYGSMTCTNSLLQSRLSPIPQTISGPVGVPITLSALNINCGQPAGPVTVQISPGGQSVTLLDDGSGQDLVAGDGIFSGQWAPSSTGSYQLSFPDGTTVNYVNLNSYSVAHVAFNYQTITGTNLNFGDDSVAQIASPFVIPFGGGSFTSLYVSSNGTISFTDPFSNYDNVPLGGFPGYVQRPMTLLAPFWMDLFPLKNTNQNVFWQVLGSAPNRQLVVEWRNVRSYACLSDPNATVTFQVVFEEGSTNVAYNYSHTEFGDACNYQDDGAEATIGLQTSPTAYTRLGIVIAGTSWLWQSPPVGITSTAPTLNAISPHAAPYFSPDLPLTVTGSGFVSSSVIQWNSVDLPTAFVSATELTAIIPANFLIPNSRYSDFGQGEIDVFNAGTGGGTSGQMLFQVQNMAPTISSISPSVIPAGSFGFAITITGENLLNSYVEWNGQALSSGASDNNHLSANVPESLIANPGTAQITAFAPPPGGGASTALPLTVTPATQASTAGSITTTQKFDPAKGGAKRATPLRFLGWKHAGEFAQEYLQKFSRHYGAPASFAFRPNAPLANQSHPDSALNLNNPNTLPGFAYHPTLPAGYIPTAVATGDFNRDGKLDWVIANGGSNDLWIYFGNGDGTAQLPVILPVGGQSPVGIAVADLRKIGILDLIVAEADSNTVGVLLGNGDGTFGPETDFQVPGPALSVAVADFNGDGKLDLIVGIQSGDLFAGPSLGPVALLLGDGAGAFGAPILSPNQSYSPESYATTGIVTADLNGDGLPDLVVIDEGAGLFTNGIVVYINQGDGTFKFSQQVAGDSPGFFAGAAVGDVNGDGCPDITASEAESGAIYVFWGNCNGSFQANGTILRQGPGETVVSVALADVNGDGHLDIVSAGAYAGEAQPYGQVSGNLVSVMLGDGKGNFSNAQVVRGERSMYGLAVADLLGNGRPEIITANQDTDTASVFMNNGQGAFGGPAGEYIGYPPPDVFNAPFTNFVVSDINGDGYPDLGLFEWPNGYVDAYPFTVLLNDGTGKFGSPIRTPAMDSTMTLSDYNLGNFRNTGHPDLLMLETGGCGSEPDQFAFSPNLGGGLFGSPILTHLNITGLSHMAIGDFDGDGKLDVVAAGTSLCSTGPVLTFYHGNGNGTFTTGTPPLLSNSAGQPLTGTFSITAVDINHDGKLDLLVLGSDDNLYELFGNGDGTFGSAQMVLSNVPTFQVADLNHDGYPDIITAQPVLNAATGVSTDSFSVYLGSATGAFHLSQTYQPYAASSLRSYLFADFNGDGNLDIAALEQDPSAPIDAPTGFTTAIFFHILIGNGDGTFTPTYSIFPTEKLSSPQSAADLNGDGRADLIELDQLPASFHVIPGTPGSSLQLMIPTTPVVGHTGVLQIALAAASSTPTVVQLTASTPNIQLPPSVTIPAGNLTAEASFAIAPAYNASHVFSITAQLATETETAYSFQLNPAFARFQLAAGHATGTTNPGGTTPDFQPQLVSIAGYSSTIQLSCQGLPLGATCLFGSLPITLGAEQVAVNHLTIQTSSSTPIGSFAFVLTATDGTSSASEHLTLNVGDFTLAVSPGSATVAPGGTTALGLSLGEVGPWPDPIGISCQVAPAISLICTPTQTGGYTPGNYPSALLVAPSVKTPDGSYTVTVVGTVDGVTHSAPFSMQVVGAPATATTLISTFNPSLVSAAVNFLVTVTSAAGAPTGVVNLMDGNTQIASATLTGSGQSGATFTISSLTQGSHSITAVYPGNSSFAVSMSPVVVQVVNPAPDFSLSISPSVTSISPGQNATFTLTITPVNGFNSQISVSCTGAPS